MGTELERLQKVLRGISAGLDPVRLLHDTLAGAVQAVGGRHGMLVGLVDGAPVPLASVGALAPVVQEVAETAIATGRMARKRDGQGGMHAVAEPVRIGSRVVGALAVGGDVSTFDPLALLLFADAAALALSRRPALTTASAPEFMDALARVAADLERNNVLVRMFDAADKLLSTAAGYCVLFEDGGARVAHFRGLDRERLRAATHHPDFKTMVTSPVMRVDPPTHPVVSHVTDGGETAVGLPLVAGGTRLGHLVLLFGEAPDAAGRALLTGFANHVALAIRAAELSRRIRDRDEQLTSIVHSMPNPVVVVDDLGRLLMVNGPASELFHLAGTFEMGQSVEGRLGNTLLETMLAGEAHRDGEVEVAIGMPPRIYRATLRRVQAATGRPLGRVMVLDDVTSEREAAQIKADLVAVIGHELRTPLTIMKGYIRTLIRRGDEIDHNARELALGALDTNAERLERLIEDLLLMSAIETGKPTMHFEPLDVASLLRERAGGRVEMGPTRGEMVAVADRPKLEQVLHHLIDNALKYSEGPVVLEVADQGDELEVAVTDSGPGVFSEDIPMLFERFHQLDGSSTRAHGGTGIGLYICRRLVEAQGGRIWCESRLGVGSRFAFSIPKDQPDDPMPLDEIDEVDEAMAFGADRPR